MLPIGEHLEWACRTSWSGSSPSSVIQRRRMALFAERASAVLPSFTDTAAMVRERTPPRRIGQPADDVDVLRSAVVEAKAALGRAEIERRLNRQIQWSDRVTRAIARASGKHRRISQVELVAPGCAAAQLPAWYLDRAKADDEAAFLAACPDHHLFRPTPDGTPHRRHPPPSPRRERRPV